jgi:hypothetical protein
MGVVNWAVLFSADVLLSIKIQCYFRRTVYFVVLLNTRVTIARLL